MKMSLYDFQTKGNVSLVLNTALLQLV